MEQGDGVTVLVLDARCLVRLTVGQARDRVNDQRSAQSLGVVSPMKLIHQGPQVQAMEVRHVTLKMCASHAALIKVRHGT